MHTHTPSHPLTLSHTLTHTHTHPQEARRLLGPAVSLRLFFQGSAKEMVRLPKGRSSRILPPSGASGPIYSEAHSQEGEVEVLLLQGLSSGETEAGLHARPAGLAERSPTALVTSSTSRIL